MTKKTKFIIAGLFTSFASQALASLPAPTVIVGGCLDTQVGHESQKGLFKTDQGFPIAHKLDSYGLVNDTKTHIEIHGHGHGFRYGGLINLNTDTSISKERESTVGHQTMLYVESFIGRLEAGSYHGVYDVMKVSGTTISRATGGIDGDWKYWVNPLVGGAFNVATFSGLTILPFKPSLPTSLDESYQANDRKFSYYTPTIAGIKAAFSFTPDTEQHGTITNLKSLTKGYVMPSSIGTTFNNTRAFTNAIQGGVSFKHQFDAVELDLSALGEVGKAKKVLFGTTTYDRHDLRAYEIGAKISYRGFGVAGSYGDWGKSGLFKTVTTSAGTVSSVAGAKSATYWTAGVSYVHNCIGVSFGYLGSEGGGFGANVVGTAHPTYSSLKGKANVYSFGIDYKAAPGLMPYAEITQFDIKDRTQASGAGKNSGTVILAGSKLTF